MESYRKQNKCWHEVVKSWSKNGNFYWVDAFITPLYDDTKAKGYQSVSLSLSYQHKTQDQNVYNNIKHGKNFKPVLLR